MGEMRSHQKNKHLREFQPYDDNEDLLLIKSIGDDEAQKESSIQQ